MKKYPFCEISALIGFSGVGAVKTVSNLHCVSLVIMAAKKNQTIKYLFQRDENHAVSLQIVGFSSPRSVKKPIEALIFASFHQGKEEAPQRWLLMPRFKALKIKQLTSI